MFFEYQVAGIKYQDASRSKMQEPREDWKYRRNKLEIIRASSGNKNLYFNPFSRSLPAAGRRSGVYFYSISTIFCLPACPRQVLRISHFSFYFTFPAGLPNTVSFFPTEEITTDPAPTRAPLPMRTPETMVTPEPINAPSSKTTSALTMDPAPTGT